MGLTLHYNLTAMKCDADEAQRLVRALHAHAQSLAFERVTPVFHETEDEPRDDTFGAVYPGRRFLETGRDIQDKLDDLPPYEPMTDEEIEAAAQELVDLFDEKNQREAMGLPPEEDDAPSFGAELIRATEGGVLDVHPIESFFFWANNAGAEAFIVGLARYPSVIEHEVNGRVESFETGLGVGWHWEGFCKTQYAGMPDAGGPDHFVRSHRAVVGVLDHAAALGLGVEVHDESGYWDHRDEAALRQSLHEWNAMVASIAGKMKDTGRDIAGPILSHPNFEHLEAEGESAFARRREQRGKSSPGESENDA